MGQVISLKKCKFKDTYVLGCGNWCWEYKAGKSPVMDAWEDLDKLCSKAKKFFETKYSRIFSIFD